MKKYIIPILILLIAYSCNDNKKPKVQPQELKGGYAEDNREWADTIPLITSIPQEAHKGRPSKDDPDGDGVWGKNDKCPNTPGSKDNYGCPAAPPPTDTTHTPPPPPPPPVDTTTTPPPPPPSSTEVSIWMQPVGTQGNEGSCVAFSIAEAFATKNFNETLKPIAFSPEWVMNYANFTANCGGTSMQVGLDVVKAKGIATLALLPYSGSNGCDTINFTAAQKLDALNYKITGYSKMLSTDRISIKALIKANRPVITALLADNSFVNAKTGFIWKTFSGSGMLPHCVIICGYDDTKNAYKIMNSWGTTWGDAGYSWIDYDFFPTKAGTYSYVIN